MKRLKLFCGIIALTIVAGVNAWIANETIASNNELELHDVERLAEVESLWDSFVGVVSNIWDAICDGIACSYYGEGNEPYMYYCPTSQASGSFAGNSYSGNLGASYMGTGANVGVSNSNSSGNNWSLQRDSNNLPQGVKCIGKTPRYTCVPILCEDLR